jgi:hypothetical protein
MLMTAQILFIFSAKSEEKNYQSVRYRAGSAIPMREGS